MLLTDILTQRRIKVPLQATTKRDAIAELVDVLVASGDISDREKALAAVLEREHTRTTGIGNGLAIPHGKVTAVNDLVMAVGRTAAPIDFESIDGKPVTLILMIISPVDRTGPHIQALARVSRMLSIDSFRNKLNHAKDAQEVWQLIVDQEESE